MRRRIPSSLRGMRPKKYTYMVREQISLYRLQVFPADGPHKLYVADFRNFFALFPAGCDQYYNYIIGYRRSSTQVHTSSSKH